MLPLLEFEWWQSLAATSHEYNRIVHQETSLYLSKQEFFRPFSNSFSSFPPSKQLGRYWERYLQLVVSTNDKSYYYRQRDTKKTLAILHVDRPSGSVVVANRVTVNDDGDRLFFSDDEAFTDIRHLSIFHFFQLADRVLLKTRPSWDWDGLAGGGDEYEDDFLSQTISHLQLNTSSPMVMVSLFLLGYIVIWLFIDEMS